VFADVDNDTWPDIIVANGHVMDNVDDIPQRNATYAERPLLFHNVSTRGAPRFREVGLQSGAAWSRPMVARGLACADIDLDGDLDVLFTTSGGKPLLLRNDTQEGKSKQHALRIVLRGVKSNKSGIGARVQARVGQLTAQEIKVSRIVRSGSSYLSQSELPLTLGLGEATRADQITIYWPSGATNVLQYISAGQEIIVEEGKGIVYTHRLHQSQGKNKRLIQVKSPQR
jgi:hypothetical protein